ncbi:MAG: Valine--tRNA ligase [Phycisphaerae bacterium]|nr:Valine--tRNA ligase [Phycisphaerae bacterium]
MKNELPGIYQPAVIEPKWQDYWEQHSTFHIGNPGDADFDTSKPKYYVLDMFPYPSGSGLHVGHPEGYTATDILSRYKRMRGFNVLHPMGWDSFGLPAEQYAVQTNVHPRITTERAISTFKQQLRKLGFSYDWSRELATTDVGYYKWTQWIFLQLFISWFDPTATGQDEQGRSYVGKARPISELISELENGKWKIESNLQIVPALSEPRASAGADWRSWENLSKFEKRQLVDNHRLAYMDEIPVNWCPMLGTVLANEEVTNDGRSERGDYPVYRLPLKQWMLRITKYCERLLSDIEQVDWPEPIKTMQRNWVGKSNGAEVDFKLAGNSNEVIRVFTTRPDTLFGATYMVLAPEHPLVERIVPAQWPADTPDSWKNLPSRGLQPTRVFSSAEPSSDAKTWLLTWTTYGTWLPGDPRSFVGRTPHPQHQHVIHNLPGEPYDADDAQLYSNAHNVMKEEPVRLSQQQADCVESSIKDVAQRHGIHLLAYAVMNDHVHIVCRCEQRADEALQLFKGNSSRVLSQTFGKPVGQWWTRSGSKRLIRHDPQSAINYVQNQVNSLCKGSLENLGIATGSSSAGAKAPGSEETSLQAVMRYVETAKNKTDLDRTADTKEKTGVFTGAYAINPLNGQPIPIWIADYVLMGYGTGAIMAVPAHDERDHAFAKKFNLPIVEVVAGGADVQSEAFIGEGTAINSGEFNGLATTEFKQRITSWLEAHGLGKGTINYKLRDWLFSRQRYWGEPFPILHGPDGEVIGLDEPELPLDLPHMDNFQPHASDDPNEPPRPPLGRVKEWAAVQRDGKTYTRELNTMPQWAGSCWYYLRFTDPKNTEQPWSSVAEKYWMNVDQYVGGAEHAVLHLLYARFWHKVLYDLGHVSTVEPFQRLFNQGLILSFAYQDQRGMTLPVDEVEERGENQFFHKTTGEPVQQIVAKMSKSLKNIVNPDDILCEFGADAFRLYEMYMGPLDASKPWNTRDIPGLYRFLSRAWRLVVDEQTDQLSPAVQPVEPPLALLRRLHQVIGKVSAHIESFKFNTAIAELITLTNELTSAAVRPRAILEPFVLLLAPFAPHIAEELWQRLGHQRTLAYEPWPTFDPQLARDDTIEIPVQINGKLRTRLQLPVDSTPDQLETAVRNDPTVLLAVGDKSIHKVIVVPGKLVNLVVR